VRAAPNNHLRLKVECQVIADVTRKNCNRH
jgi:hypothetical protein